MDLLTDLDLSDLEQFVENPLDHINAFTSTFEQVIQENGENTFAPMITIFKDRYSFEISIKCRMYSDKDDMYVAFNEMLQFYSASEAHSFIFAADTRMNLYDQSEPHTKVDGPSDALCLSFVSSESSGIVSIPYKVIDNKVHWSKENIEITQLAKDDPSKVFQGEMVELFYIMTHLDGPMFSPAQLLNYYSCKGFEYILSETSKIESIKVK